MPPSPLPPRVSHGSDEDRNHGPPAPQSVNRLSHRSVSADRRLGYGLRPGLYITHRPSPPPLTGVTPLAQPIQPLTVSATTKSGCYRTNIKHGNFTADAPPGH